MNTVELLEKLKNTSAEIFSRYPVLFAYVYGSCATGTIHPFSDLDIGVFFDPNSAADPLECELDLALDIDRNLGHVIESDVRAINELPLMFLGRILTEGVLVYSRDESTRVEFEVQARKKFFDFMPVIHDYRKAYVKAARR